MATFIATDLSGFAAGVQMQEKGDFTQIRKYSLTTALALNDIVQAASIPADCSLVDVQVSITDIDTNGTPLVSFTVGRLGATADFIASNTSGRTGGVARMDVIGALGYTPTADTPVLVTFTAAAATAAAGTIIIAVTCNRAP